MSNISILRPVSRFDEVFLTPVVPSIKGQVARLKFEILDWKYFSVHDCWGWIFDLKISHL